MQPPTKARRYLFFNVFFNKCSVCLITEQNAIAITARAIEIITVLSTSIDVISYSGILNATADKPNNFETPKAVTP